MSIIIPKNHRYERNEIDLKKVSTFRIDIWRLLVEQRKEAWVGTRYQKFIKE